MTSRYSLRKKLIFDPSHPKVPRNAVFEIHEVTPDGRRQVKETFHDADVFDWSQPARSLWNKVRAFTPWPGAFFFQEAAPKPRLIKVWEAKVEESLVGPPGQVLSADKAGIVVGCGYGSLRILGLQREGGRRLSAQEFLAGHPLGPGEQLLKPGETE